MLQRQIGVVFFVLLITLLACSPSPEKARKELAEMKTPYTIDEFVDRAEKGDFVAVELFLASRMNPNAVHEGSRHTALVAAAAGGHTEIVKLLVDKGADVKANGIALALAAGKGHLDVVKVLLKAGADANARDVRGRTALFSATSEGHFDVADFILTHSDSEETRRFLRQNALMDAADSGGNNTVKFLLDKGADINGKYDQGFTVLIGAAEKGRGETVRLLLNRGAEVNAKDNFGQTPLMKAAHDGEDPMRKLNEKYGISSFESSGSYLGYLGTLRVLLEKGADFNARDNEGKTAMMLATRRQRKDAIRLLKRAGAKE